MKIPVVVLIGVDPPLEGLGGPQGELHEVLVARLRNYNRHGTIKKHYFDTNLEMLLLLPSMQSASLDSLW